MRDKRLDELEEATELTDDDLFLVKQGNNPLRKVKKSTLASQFGSGGPGGGVPDHGALTGLTDDDHSQYHNNTRGDARYYTKSEVVALDAAIQSQVDAIKTLIGQGVVDGDAVVDTLSELLTVFSTYTEGVNVATIINNLQNKVVTGIAFTGNATKTLTVTFADGSTITGNFTDNTSEGGGGAATWGGITGTLSEQTDLQAALAAKDTALSSAIGTEVTNRNTAITAASDALKGGVASAGDTLAKLYSLFQTLDSLVTGTTPDGDSVTDTVQEILAIFSTYPEGVDVATALASKLPSSSFTGAAIKALLESLSGADRLDAAAIKNLPSGSGTNLGWFDITTYGAVADGVTDNTAAIQSAINACHAAGGGVVYTPYSTNTFKVSGALVTSLNSVNPNCQLYIPNTTLSEKMVSITFLGGAPPNFATETVGLPRNSQGSIWESTIVGTGSVPSMLASPWQNYPSIGDRNYVEVHFENMIFRTNTKSGSTDIVGTMSAVNGSHFNGMAVKDCKADITSRIDQMVSPTNETFGFIFPSINNKVILSTEGCVYCEGYKYGLVAQEHQKCDYLIFVGCYNGLVVDHAHHGINIQEALFENCVNNVLMRGQANVYISSFHTEHYTTGWWANQYDVFFEASPSNVVPSFAGNLGFLKTSSVHIEHFNQVTPAVGVQNLFVTNDYSKTRVKRINDVDLDETIQLITYSATPAINLLNGYKATLSLTGNAAATISTPFNGKQFELFVKQDATGGRTLSIGGVTVPITATANAISKVKGTYSTAFGWMFASEAQNSTPTVSYSAITFGTLTNLTNTSGNYKATTNNNAWGNTGLAPVKMPSGVDGILSLFYNSTAHRGGTLGLNSTNAVAAQDAMEVGFWIGGDGLIYRIDSSLNPKAQSTGVAAVLGRYYAIFRVVSTYSIRWSTDESNWTSIYTFSYSGNADMWPVIDVYGDNTVFSLNQPKGASLA